MATSRRTSARLAASIPSVPTVSPPLKATPPIKAEIIPKVELEPTETKKSTPRSSKSKSHVPIKREIHFKAEVTTYEREIEEVKEEKETIDEPKPAKRRRIKKEIDLATFEYPTRFHDSNKYVGAHVSISGGIHNAVHNALLIGARAFALFTKNQRQWNAPPLITTNVNNFALRCNGKVSKVDPNTSNEEEKGEQEEFTLGDGIGFNRDVHVLPHGCYLVNLANPDVDKWAKSLQCFIDELDRAEQLGIGLFNFHPGSSTGACPKEEAIKLIATGINQAHIRTRSIVIVLENMAGKGNIIGGNFNDLAQIIDLVEDKTRVGVCLDTCHAFAAGYDFRTREAYEQTMTSFGETVGFKYLKALHLNDSKGAFESHRDLHENIGMGNLGLMAFAFLMSDPRLDHLPLILETPMLDQTLNASGPGGLVWQKEIKLLYRLEKIGPDEKLIESDEIVQTLFGEIRETVLECRKQKELKKLATKNKKDQKKVDDDDNMEEDEEML